LTSGDNGSYHQPAVTPPDDVGVAVVVDTVGVAVEVPVGLARVAVGVAVEVSVGLARVAVGVDGAVDVGVAVVVSRTGVAVVVSRTGVAVGVCVLVVVLSTSADILSASEVAGVAAVAPTVTTASTNSVPPTRASTVVEWSLSPSLPASERAPSVIDGSVRCRSLARLVS
jgi:hypothetical protein